MASEMNYLGKERKSIKSVGGYEIMVPQNISDSQSVNFKKKANYKSLITKKSRKSRPQSGIISYSTCKQNLNPF